MPTSATHRSHQRGVVLVIGLILLLMITVLALATMSSTNMQERMAGNARTQALAFQVASLGASDALNFYIEQRKSDDDGQLLCGASNGAWSAPPEPVAEEFDIDNHPARLTRSMHCIEPATANEEIAAVRPQLFIVSDGEILDRTKSTVLARRSLAVRISLGPPARPDCTSLCFPGCTPGENGDSFQFPNSNKFSVDGAGAPAIATTGSECQAAVEEAIGENRIGNYDGGVANFGDAELPWPWTSPKTVNQFRQDLLLKMAESIDFGADGKNLDENTEIRDPPSGSIADTARYTYRFEDKNSAFMGDTYVFGTQTDPQITYIAGDAQMGGSVSGAGILVVEGNLSWNGTPNFNGLILVLGESLQIDGGGQGGNFAGSLVVANIWDEYEGFNKKSLASKFGPIDVVFEGGGTANYTFGCDELRTYSEELGLGAEDINDTKNWWPECAAEADGGEDQFRIVSMRDTLGWGLGQRDNID